MNKNTNECDKDINIDCDDVSHFDNDFAKDIFDVIDSFLDKDNIDDSFKIKKAIDYQFNKHCLAGELKSSKESNIYYDFDKAEIFKNNAEVYAIEAKEFGTLLLDSLGDKDKVISAFRRFFEEDEFLKIAPQCGFSYKGKELTLLLNSCDNKTTKNYNGKIIIIVLLIGDEIHNFYPIDMEVFLKKINTVVEKHYKDVELIKINPEAKRRRTLYDITLKKAKEIYGDIVNPYILKRLDYELDELSKNFGLKVILQVFDIQSFKLSQGQIFISRAFLNNSLLFYLLGIGSTNPMPRHHYCPNCHSFHWGEKKLAEKCDCCGASLKEDGYDLPFELLLDDFKRNGVEFSYLTDENVRFPIYPSLHYVRSSDMELASILGLTQEEINSNDIDIRTVCHVIRCLVFPKDKKEESYYSMHYKKYSTYEHRPFIGIQDLGCELLFEAMNNCFKDVKSFDGLVKVLSSLHGTGVIEANLNCLNGRYIDKAITSIDELYQYLIKAQLSEDDALLVCRETRLSGKDYLSPLIVSKLKDAGEGEKFISFLEGVQKLFYKGQTVARARLALLLAKIYLDDPMRYYRAFFDVNEKWVKQINDYDFIKGLANAKYKTYEDIYLGAIDLEERGYDAKKLIEEIKENSGKKTNIDV